MSSMKRQTRSDNPRRIQLLRDMSPPTLNGIDYLEVTSNGQPLLLFDSQAICAPTGTPLLIVASQTRVTAM